MIWEKVNNRQLEGLFILTLFLYLGLLFINQTELVILVNPIEKQIIRMVRYFCYLLFLAKILLTSGYKKKYLLIAMTTFLLVALCAFSSNHRIVIITALVCVAAYGCDYRKIIQCSTLAFGLGLSLTITLCFCGVLRNQVLSTERERYNLGFNWVTLPAIYYLFITLGYVNIRRDKIKWYELVALEAINYWLYTVTDARLAFFLDSCVIVFIGLEKYVLKNRWGLLNIVGKKVVLLPFIICGCMYLIQSLYTPGVEFWDSLNAVLSGRLKLAYNNFQTYPITLFGQEIPWQGFSLGEGFLPGNPGATYNNVDCSYFRIYFDYGIVGLLITLWLYAVGLIKAATVKNQYLVFSYVVILLFCLTEQWIIELAFNPAILISSAIASTTQLCKTRV